MNIDLRKKGEKLIWKRLFKLMENALFGKTMENVRQQWYIELFITEKKKKLFSFRIKFSYYNVSHRKVISNRNEQNRNAYKNTCLFRNFNTKISKILMYELWYDYVKQKRGKKVKLCYMDTDNFILYIKTDDIFTLQKMLKLHLILQIIN